MDDQMLNDNLNNYYKIKDKVLISLGMNKNKQFYKYKMR